MKLFHQARRVAEIVQRGLTTVTLALVYFGVLTPIAWVLRRRGHDPLSQKTTSSTAWEAADASTADRSTDKMY